MPSPTCWPPCRQLPGTEGSSGHGGEASRAVDLPHGGEPALGCPTKLSDPTRNPRPQGSKGTGRIRLKSHQPAYRGAMRSGVRQSCAGGRFWGRISSAPPRPHPPPARSSAAVPALPSPPGTGRAGPPAGLWRERIGVTGMRGGGNPVAPACFLGRRRLTHPLVWLPQRPCTRG